MSGGQNAGAGRAGPTDAETLRLQASAAAANGLLIDAERLLRDAIELAPTFVPAFVDLASFLCRAMRTDEAITLLDEVLAKRQPSLWALSLKAAVLESERRADEAMALHEKLIAQAPGASVPWLNYGHALKAIGRLADAVAAYRRSLELDPANGYAWWGLANLRTVSLGAQDVALMERVLPRVADDLGRVQLHFALGKALGDLGEFGPSFRHYERANELRGKLAPYDATAVNALGRQVEAMFTADFLAQRSEQGCAAADPIFIIGMPRSGSTLVEQILASHPMVEGLGELSDLGELAARVDGKAKRGASWPEAASRLGTGELRDLGEDYLARTRRFRRTDRPFFTDKMPANWQYLGLIQLILPNAKIIDVRRHSAACCFGAFSTYFSRETHVPSSLEDWAGYQRDYVDAVGNFETVLPGRIHRVRYEHLVEDLEGEVARLLAYLGLPFDEACLRFHDNRRAVYTPSAQQVRQPINRDGLERWRSYEPWLAPLECESGDLQGSGGRSPTTAPPEPFVYWNFIGPARRQPGAGVLCL